MTSNPNSQPEPATVADWTRNAAKEIRELINKDSLVKEPFPTLLDLTLAMVIARHAPASPALKEAAERLKPLVSSEETPADIGKAISENLFDLVDGKPASPAMAGGNRNYEPKGADLLVRMALGCLEELEPTAMGRKRRMVRNFNEHAERESQLSAARVSLDRALDLLVGAQARDETAESALARANERVGELERENNNMKAAIMWALGEIDDFPQRKEGQGVYWWRSELRRRAALSSARA